MVVDLCQSSQFGGVVAEVKRTFGHIDILVNNAGAVLLAPALDVEENSWDRVMDTNSKGAFFILSEGWPSHGPAGKRR